MNISDINHVMNNFIDLSQFEERLSMGGEFPIYVVHATKDGGIVNRYLIDPKTVDNVPAGAILEMNNDGKEDDECDLINLTLSSIDEKYGFDQDPIQVNVIKSLQEMGIVKDGTFGMNLSFFNGSTAMVYSDMLKNDLPAGSIEYLLDY